METRFVLFFLSSDAKCGKIQCQTSASKPLESNAVAIDSTIILDGKRIHCRGTHVYRSEDEGDMFDPGLVMAGTKCGDSHVSVGRLLQFHILSPTAHCRKLGWLSSKQCAAFNFSVHLFQARRRECEGQDYEILIRFLPVL